MSKMQNYINTIGLSLSSTGEADSQLQLLTKKDTMNGKPVIMLTNARTVLNLKIRKFEEKRLCNGITLNLGTPASSRAGFDTSLHN